MQPIKDEVLEKLLGKEWSTILKDEFSKPYMLNLSSFLQKRRLETIVFPRPSQVFNAYKYTPFSEVRVVILGEEPYIDNNQANGLCYSIPESNLEKLHPNLENIRRELEDDVYDGLMLDFNPDLTRWAKQGVFLLNTILTVDKGLPLSHKNKGWELITKHTIHMLNFSQTRIIYLLWGKRAKEYKEYIDLGKHIVLEAGHPSPVSAARGHWFGSKHFSQVNRILKNRGDSEIVW